MTGFQRIGSFNFNNVLATPPSGTTSSPGDKPLVRPQDGVDPIVANGGSLLAAAGAFLVGKFVEGFVEGSVTEGIQQTGKNVASLLTPDKGPGPAAGTKQPTDGASGNSGGTGGASGNSGSSSSGTPESSGS